MKIITDENELNRLQNQNACNNCIFCTETSVKIDEKHKADTIFSGVEDLPTYIPIMDMIYTCNKHNKETCWDAICDDYITNKNGGVQ